MVGTVVVIEERAGVEKTDIWLRLRTTRKPIFVSADRLYDCVLGTDFSYADFRFWVPFDTLLLEKAEEGSFNGQAVTLISGRVCATGLEERAVTMAFCAESGVLSEMIWSRSGECQPVRVLQAEDCLKIDGIWTPRVIVVSRPQDGYSSRMMLRGITHKLAVDDILFDPERVDSAHLAELTTALELVHTDLGD